MNGELVRISLKQIMIAIPVIKKMISVYLPIQTSYWIKRNVDNMVRALKGLDENRNNLIRKYGLKDESGNITVSKANELYYWADYNLLLEEIVDVIINKVPVSDLKKTELSKNDQAAIAFMLKDENDSSRK
jgi:nuclear transport factor 2 (NTF2) superfamily protein